MNVQQSGSLKYPEKGKRGSLESLDLSDGAWWTKLSYVKNLSPMASGIRGRRPQRPGDREPKSSGGSRSSDLARLWMLGGRPMVVSKDDEYPPAPPIQIPVKHIGFC